MAKMGPKTKPYIDKPSLFVIAIDPDLFSAGSKTGSYFKWCLEACEAFATSLLFTSSQRFWSPFALILAQSPESNVLVESTSKIPDTIKFLRSKCQQTNEELEAICTRAEPFDFGNFLLFCSRKLHQMRTEYYARKIVFISNNSDPTCGDRQRRFAALNSASNLKNNEISFELLSIKCDLDFDLFYNEMFYVMGTIPHLQCIEDVDGLTAKLSSLLKVQVFGRKTKLYPFLGDPTHYVLTTQQTFVRKAKILSNHYASRNGKRLKKIMPTKTVQGYKIKSVPHSPILTVEECEAVKRKFHMVPIGLSLLHLGPRISTVGVHLGRPTLLKQYFSEQSENFNVIWEYCMDRERTICCLRKYRKNAAVRYVELIPKHVNNTRYFLIVNLPFIKESTGLKASLICDDFYQYKPSTDQQFVTNQLIDQLTCDFDQKMFLNPALLIKKHWLQKQLFKCDEDDEIFEELKRNSIPDPNGIDAQLNGLQITYKNVFNLIGNDDGRKRKTYDGRAKGNFQTKR